MTPEAIDALSPAELDEVIGALEQAIAAADVEATRLRMQAGALNLAGQELAVDAEKAYETALPEIRQLVAAGQHDEAQAAINKLLDDGQRNTERVLGDNPTALARVLAGMRAVEEAQGLRTDASADVLPKLELGAQINNPQQSWGFDGEPPKAVMKDFGTRDGTS